jgi:CubicO group peptidase (beta-lactamase class C family)
MNHRFRSGPLVAVVLTLGPVAGADPVYPGQTWEERKPAAVGLDAAALKRFSDRVGGRGCVVRNGYLVYSWGDPRQRGDVASAAKPVYAHFLFLAVERGLIPDLDEKVVKYEPRLADKDRAITWRHLATQTSCYGVAEKPGEAFDYSDPQMALFWDLLFGKVYGATPATVDAKVLRPLLADPLGCEDSPTMLAFGEKDRPGRLAMSPRDFCRFGLLYLHKGRWRDRQLLPEKVAVTVMSSPLPAKLPRTAGKPAAMIPGQRTIGGGNNQTDHFGSYSFLWWANGTDRDGQRHWPDAPADAYGASGHSGKRAMFVLPSQDLVVSWNDARIDGRNATNDALKLLAAAVRRGE